MKKRFKISALILASVMMFGLLFAGVSDARSLDPNARASTISLKAYNGQQVCAEPNGKVIANRNWIGEWEKFSLIPLRNGYYVLKAHSNGKYVAFEPGGRVVADRTRIGEWEQFSLKRNRNGTYNLQARSNKKFVCAENGGGRELVANRSVAREWEAFTFTWHYER